MPHHDPRAGLDALVLHCTHSGNTLYVPERVPLANIQPVQSKRTIRKPVPALTISPPRSTTPISVLDDFSPDTPLSLSISTPCTPFQPLPPVFATSPLRLPSFLDLALHSDPPPQPAQLIDIPSVTHPNSPYVPWPSPIRRTILRPLTPSSQVSRYSRPYSRSGARAPEPQDDVPAPSRLLRLRKSLKNIKEGVVKHVKKALRKMPKAKLPPSPPPLPIAPLSIIPSPVLPSPTVSCESSKTNTLVEWLRDCAAAAEHAIPTYMTLEEYEERGSWRDLRSVGEVPSPLFSDVETDDASQRVPSPSPGPISTCTNSDVFPRLSMLDVWPLPPGSASLDRDRRTGS
ncbi:hypothetical protein C8F01DRAFT_427026 [Mycena amicta]|nr:hypothetical protein C8F01DRAFT_427026 [Mycena amicta]